MDELCIVYTPLSYILYTPIYYIKISLCFGLLLYMISSVSGVAFGVGKNGQIGDWCGSIGLCSMRYTISMDAKEEVRARLNIEDVVGEYVQLKRAGRSYKGLSPFTSERTPSFFVSPEKNIWHDFSSGRGGDVFSFIMEVEGLDFRQALELLARKAGVDLSLYEQKGNRDLARRKQRLLEAHRLAANFYQHCLVRSQDALVYVFRTRRLSKAIVQQFQIGYAPRDGHALVTYLKKKGFSLAELREAGLVNRYDGDLFRGRMMVPLMDASGQVIGFTARLIADVPNAPKYLNTPQTLLYDKGRHVFGLMQAKQAIRAQGYAVIVEGNMDVISSHQAGEAAVVATAGTAMTEQHIRALKRLTGDIRLSFDGDKAGRAATERAIGLAAQAGVELKVVSLPAEAKDPDELIQQQGVAAWQQAIAAAQPAVDWLLAQYRQQLDLTTAAGKRQFTTVGLALVNRLGDPVEREHYQRQIAQAVGSSVQAVQTKAQQMAPVAPVRKAVKAAAPRNRYLVQDDVLALAMLDGPSQELFGRVDPQLFAGEARQALAQYYAAHHGQPLKSTPPLLQNFDEYITMVRVRADARYGAWSETDRYYETARLLRQIETEHKQQHKHHLITHLRQAEESGDTTAAAALREQLNQLIKEIARGNRR